MPKASSNDLKPTKRKPTKSKATNPQRVPVKPPTRTLVLDNGGDCIKFGWSDESEVRKIPNVTARLPQQWTVLVGDQLFSLQNPNSASVITRSTERGMINNMGNQVQVWKRALDLMNISIPVTDTSSAFGWKPNTKANATPSISCAVLIALPPYCPRTLLDQICLVWFGDFGFSHVGFCVSPAVASIARSVKDLPVACVVDLGWSATHIVPVCESRAIEGSIRRLPVGARHLINIWKHYTTYRQWNMMDQEWVMRDVFEKTSFVSLDYQNDMKLAQRKPLGRRPYDRAYILPDFDQRVSGVVEIPESVKRELEKKDEDEDDNNSDENDSDFDEKDMQDDDEDVEMEGGDEMLDEEDDQSDEEESQEELRKRLLLQREEEERRRRDLEAQQQTLKIGVERFAIPETLFRPSDTGFPLDWAGLPAAIVQAVEACPLVYRAALYKSVVMVGGLSRLSNVKERLERELRTEVPSQYSLVVSVVDKPEDQAYLGAQQLSKEVSYEKWSINRDEWMDSSSHTSSPWKRLLLNEGGFLT